MKPILAFFIFCFTWIGSAQDTKTGQLTTTYFFIRHAEKDISNPKNKDPQLTREGKIRAENWAKILKETPIDFVYTTDYVRTRNTATPIAKSKGLKLTLYNPKDLNNTNFKQRTKGKTTVVVGHSNTTPTFVNKVIGENKYKSIDETIYGKLFIIKVTENSITDTVLTID